MVCLKDFWQYLRTLWAFSIWIGTGILLAVTIIYDLRNRILPFENVASHRFSALFPFRGSGFAIYICLEGGVVIFDELWAFTGIDIRVNLIHFPVFGDSEVNLAALLIYSEHMFADILNWWVLQRRWTVGITIYVRVCYAPEK